MTPLVSVVIGTYLKENDRYLQDCLLSIRRQDCSYAEIEVIVVSSGEWKPEIPPWAKGIHSKERLHYPEAINLGVSVSDQNSKYILILNDDVILSQHAIPGLISAAADYKVILNSFSNCDNFWYYNAVIKLGDKNLDKRFYRYDEINGHQRDIMDYPAGPNILLHVNYVCFYATLIPRAVWDEVGTLDENFKTGHDDEDYCKRAYARGIASLVYLGSFIFHYGGVSAESAITDSDRVKNKAYFDKKWGVVSV